MDLNSLLCSLLTMKKESIRDFLKEEDPEMLEEIEKCLSDETNLRIIKFIYEEQKGLPHMAVIGVEKDGKRERILYKPTPINPEKLTLSYISKKLKIPEDELRIKLKDLSQYALIVSFLAKKGMYFTLTNTAISYVKEIYCHILS